MATSTPSLEARGTGHGIQAERTAGPNLTSLPPLDPRLPTLGRALPVRLTRPPRPTNTAGATPPCRHSRAAHLAGTGPARAQIQAPSPPDPDRASSPSSHSARARRDEGGRGLGLRSSQPGPPARFILGFRFRACFVSELL
ncbi:unnamed protein product [Rangifer tarandus platyrhynchus]|uniref:Uncharacterized protein n=1 Tax=Rangifer tarandus platyrhynchus TaxID=3082113 RepID=A0ABN8YVE7_RANTA|nr:unnamed protein product [Rangifer tarandus platyrhynchus]